jgi:regulator of replication initiation timing
VHARQQALLGEMREKLEQLLADNEHLRAEKERLTEYVRARAAEAEKRERSAAQARERTALAAAEHEREREKQRLLNADLLSKLARYSDDLEAARRAHGDDRNVWAQQRRDMEVKIAVNEKAAAAAVAAAATATTNAAAAKQAQVGQKVSTTTTMVGRRAQRRGGGSGSGGEEGDDLRALIAKLLADKRNLETALMAHLAALSLAKQRGLKLQAENEKLTELLKNKADTSAAASSAALLLQESPLTPVTPAGRPVAPARTPQSISHASAAASASVSSQPNPSLYTI